LDPSKGTGVAPGATLVTSFFSNIITDAERHMRDHDMLITNNSYGSGTTSCDLFGDYDLSSVFIDAQLHAHDTLTHVFAAGNSGAKTCSPYARRYATILTGWQCAKNTISVGMTTNKDALTGASSRGPVDDGRLKPEICAVGSGVTSTRPNNLFAGGGGTSYSSPAITGITTLMYEQYIALNGTRPKAALIKALMLNTADDLGRAGPDYFFGYGRVNARRAVQSLTSGSYFEGDLTQGDSITLHIDVPSGASQLRVMLLWSDPAGAPFASPAIINDLDMTVSDPTDQWYQPWILDPSPSGVNMPAVRGRDSLNNHEQVTISDPQAGEFEIVIRGSNIPVGNQHYVVVFEVIMPGITVIHPNGFEPLRPGSADLIRWDAYGDAVGSFVVEYSFDGSVWETLSSTVSSSRRYLNWTVPDTFAQNAMIRVTAGSFSDSSNHDIVILDAPGGLTVTSPCATFAELSWQSVTGVDHYRVFQYIDDDMVVIDTTSNTNHTIAGITQGTKNWYSVAAVTFSGIEGPRAAAKSILPAENTDCMWSDDLRVSGILNLDNGRINTTSALSNAHALQVRIVNAGTDTASGFDIGYLVNAGFPFIETFTGDIPPGGDTTYTFNTLEDLSAPGTYTIAAWTRLTGDAFPENDTFVTAVIQAPNAAVTLPWTENFENLIDTVLDTDDFAFGGLAAWDYNITSGAGRLRTWAGNGFILEGLRSITLDETLYQNTAIHDISATINLSAYDTATDRILLTFDFMHHELIADDNMHDNVWIRGNDTSAWILLLDLYTAHAMPGEAVQLNSGLEISSALSVNNQNFSSSFQLRFGQEGNASSDSPGSEDGYTFDNIKLFAPAEDLKLASFEGPVGTGCGIGDEHISIRVINTSPDTFSKVALSYSVNGNTAVTELLIEFLPGTDTIYAFNTTYDFSAHGKYNIDVWIHHENDTYNNNDSILMQDIFSFPEISVFPYFEDFETGSGGWLSSGVFNSFALGKPGAAIIHKAASGDNAWVTNLEGNYHHDEVSFLTSPCFDLSALIQPVLSFAHIQELENNYDFLWVEFSDNGGVWTKLGAVGEGTNWYNDAVKIAWDNVNTRWHVASIDVPINSSQVQFRFAFFSDIGLEMEGVGIDAIHIHEKNTIAPEVSASPASQPASGSDWVHFDTPDGRVFSVHPDGQDLGSIDVNMYFFTGSQRNDGEAYLYARNWVVTAEQAPVTPVRVRYYITELDFAIIANATGCGSCTVPRDAFESASFKFSGTTEDSILTNNFGGEYQYYHNADVLVLPYDNGYAVEIEVADFSEFWLTGLRTRAADTLYQTIRSTNDDAEELISSGGVNPYSDTLDLSPSYLTGLRFQDIGIPQGAFVREARLVFTPEFNQSVAGNVTISGAAQDDTDPFNTGNYNISQRPKTDLYFNWAPPLWTLEDTITTPSLRALVQEIVDRPAWQPGNALGFSLFGTGDAQAYAYDADPSKATRLYLIYDSICDLQQRLYVDRDATGENTGNTWADAMPDLQHALDLAGRCAEITDIWVSEGTYLPAIEEQGKAFRLQNGVRLYGGFSGVETALSQRDPGLHVTVLSGDIGQGGTITDDAYHVVTVDVGTDTVTVDGFIIKNGYAFGTSTEDQSGGGIRSNGNILLQNCIIEACSAQLNGSGIYHSGSNMTFILSNCTLRNNSGSAIKNTGSGSMYISDDTHIENND
ncbi:MAG: hypothetical protein DRI69_11235, partial [Bacteroidetes bacterium]